MSRSKFGRRFTPELPSRATVAKDMAADGHTQEEITFATNGIHDKYPDVGQSKTIDSPLARQLSELTERVRTLERQLAELRGQPPGIIERLTGR